MPHFWYIFVVTAMVGIVITYALLFISLYFEVFLLVTFLERKLRGRAQPAAASAELPSVAIIVPCYNEERTVEATIRSLLQLKYPHEKLSVIVADDGSTDATLARARQFEPRVTILHKNNGGKHSAMNYALAHTDAQLIGCLDADSTVAPDALTNIAPVFADDRVAAVTASIHTKAPQNVLQHIQHVEYLISIFNRFMLSALGAAYITPGPFSIFRSSVVRELGGWQHGHSTEDLEMALRMQQAGYLIGNAPKAIVHTATPRTLRHLFRQRVRWTYGFLRNAADYRSMIGRRSYGNLGLLVLPLALFSIIAGIFFFANMLLSFVQLASNEYVHITAIGGIPQPTAISLFYINTSALLFLLVFATLLILVLISIGSHISTGRSRPPIGTPLFLAFYSFLVPFWLGTALVRAVLRTGVRWR